VNSFIESEISGLSADKNIEISATSGSSTVYLYLLFEWITDNTGFSSDLKSVAVYDGTKDMYDESGIKTGEEPTVEELYCGETNSITSEHVGLGFNQTLLNKRLGVKITFVSLLSDVSEIVSITAQIIPLGDYDSLCEESTAALPILIRGKDFRDVIDPEGDGVQINNVLVALSKFGSKIDESDEDSVVDLAFILTMLNNFGK